jgi:hypothetical protein
LPCVGGAIFKFDGRLLTLEGAAEFFNLILETKLTEEEKQDLVALCGRFDR